MVWDGSTEISSGGVRSRQKNTAMETIVAGRKRFSRPRVPGKLRRKSREPDLRSGKSRMGRATAKELTVARAAVRSFAKV